MRAAAGLIAVLILAGCGGGGDKPSSGPPAAPRTMRLASPAFHDGGVIPTRFTCSGEGNAPKLAVADAPGRTRELALVVEDRDAGNFVHRILLRIPPRTSVLGKPPGAIELENSFGKRGWGAPCPPKGDKPHRYVFTVYALDAPLSLGEDASPNDVHDALARHALARGTLTGRFSRS